MNYLNFSFNFLLALCFAQLLSLTSCMQPDSPIIPIPATHEGPAINLMATGTHQTSLYDFSVIEVDYTSQQEVFVPFPPLTQKVIQEGTVLVFWKDMDGWKALPTTQTFASGQVQSLIFKMGISTLLLESDTNGGSLNPFTGNFRTIIIPSKLSKTHSQLDACNYEAIAKQFELL